MSTNVSIISPVLWDGVWHMSGGLDVPHDVAEKWERQGLVDIVSVDGQAVVWPSCCNGTGHQ